MLRPMVSTSNCDELIKLSVYYDSCCTNINSRRNNKITASARTVFVSCPREQFSFRMHFFGYPAFAES
jgi:hypothetical protein